MKGLCYTIMTEVRNKSKGLQWIYGPALFGMPSDDQDVIWLSHWKFGNKLEGGDELTVSVLTSSYMIYDEFQVKEFGVQVVYYEQVTVTAQENFTKDNPFYPRVIAGDLSHYLLPGSSGTYLLCHNPVLERRDVLSYVWFKHNSNEITGVWFVCPLCVCVIHSSYETIDLYQVGRCSQVFLIIICKAIDLLFFCPKAMDLWDLNFSW